MQKGKNMMELRAGQTPQQTNWFDGQVKRAGTAPIYQFQKNPRQQQKIKKQQENITQQDQQQKKVVQGGQSQQQVKNDIRQISKIYSCNNMKLKEKLFQQQQQQLQHKQRLQQSCRPQTQEQEGNEGKLPPAKSGQKGQYQHLSHMMNYLNQGRQFYWSTKRDMQEASSPKDNHFHLFTHHPQRQFNRSHLVKNKEHQTQQVHQIHQTQQVHQIHQLHQQQQQVHQLHQSQQVHQLHQMNDYQIKTNKSSVLQSHIQQKQLQQIQFQTQQKQKNQHQQQQSDTFQLQTPIQQSLLQSNRPQSSIGRRVKRERENSIVDSQKQNEKYCSLLQEDQQQQHQQYQQQQQQFQQQQIEHYYQHSRRTNYNRPPSQAGIRRKDYAQLSNTNQEVFFGSILQNDSQYNIDYSKRPQSRQKTPQKALELELQDDDDNLLQEIPVKNMFEQDFPIKSMYEDVPFMTNIKQPPNQKYQHQQQQQYQLQPQNIPIKQMYDNSFQENFQEIDDQNIDFSKVNDSSEEMFQINKRNSNHSVQSIDIENTYKIINKQMRDNQEKKQEDDQYEEQQDDQQQYQQYQQQLQYEKSNFSQNQTITTKLDGSNIVMKHVVKKTANASRLQNNSRNPQSNLSIPFETSLGNDFLSLFANTKESKLYN